MIALIQHGSRRRSCSIPTSAILSEQKPAEADASPCSWFTKAETGDQEVQLRACSETSLCADSFMQGVTENGSTNKHVVSRPGPPG